MAPSSEETPLLTESSQRKTDVYDRFSPSRKAVIVVIVSWSGLIPLFVAGSFIPSIPQIVKEFHSTAPVINLAVSLSILAVSFSSLVWATYSGFYGRRPIYLISLPFLCLGSLGVGFSQNVPMLMVCRVIQAAGSSAGMSVGSGAIADIYRLEERGTAMGIFFAACLLGPALAPLAGGIAAHYFTWRHMHYALFLAGLAALGLVFFFLPETSHPGTRGVDRVQDDCHYGTQQQSRKRFVWLNPVGSLWLLRSPNMMAMTLIGTVVLLTDYGISFYPTIWHKERRFMFYRADLKLAVLLVPLAYTIGAKYNITNEALIGAFFLPAGAGNFIGAPLAGRISDLIVIKWRKRRNGEWVPEDRLRATMIGAAFLVPMSVLLSGAFTRFVPGKTGIVLNLICLFANGLGVDFVLSPSAAYNVDVLHSRSAEIMAANNGFRGLILAMCTALILPSINTFGVFYTNLFSAVLAWLGALFMWITIKYGGRMRAWLDVGFSTIETA